MALKLFNNKLTSTYLIELKKLFNNYVKNHNIKKKDLERLYTIYENVASSIKNGSIRMSTDDTGNPILVGTGDWANDKIGFVLTGDVWKAQENDKVINALWEIIDDTNEAVSDYTGADAKFQYTRGAGIPKPVFAEFTGADKVAFQNLGDVRYEMLKKFIRGEIDDPSYMFLNNDDENYYKTPFLNFLRDYKGGPIPKNMYYNLYKMGVDPTYFEDSGDTKAANFKDFILNSKYALYRGVYPAAYTGNYDIVQILKNTSPADLDKLATYILQNKQYSMDLLINLLHNPNTNVNQYSNLEKMHGITNTWYSLFGNASASTPFMTNLLWNSLTPVLDSDGYEYVQDFAKIADGKYAYTWRRKKDSNTFEPISIHDAPIFRLKILSEYEASIANSPQGMESDIDYIASRYGFKTS